MITAADARGASSAVGADRTAGDDDSAGVIVVRAAIVAGADARRAVSLNLIDIFTVARAAGRDHRAAVNGDIGVDPAVVSASDARACAAPAGSFRVHIAVVDRDGDAASLVAAADARAIVAAGRVYSAAVDRHAAGVLVHFGVQGTVAGADARAQGAACCVHFAAVDRHRAGHSVLASADARSAIVAFGSHVSAVNGDGAAVAVVAAADARAAGFLTPTAARCLKFSAPDRDGAAVAVIAAAHARGLFAAVGCDDAAVLRIASGGAVLRLVARADARAVIAARRGDGAAVDRDVSSAGLVAAADARGVGVAGGFDGAAVDDDRSGGVLIAVVLVVGAYGGVVAACRSDQLAAVIRLTVDAQRGALRHTDALFGGQRHAVGEDQTHVSADGDAVSKGQGSVQHIPAVGHGVVRK